jgi:hypothetical protein
MTMCNSETNVMTQLVITIELQLHAHSNLKALEAFTPQCEKHVTTRLTPVRLVLKYHHLAKLWRHYKLAHRPCQKVTNMFAPAPACMTRMACVGLAVVHSFSAVVNSFSAFVASSSAVVIGTSAFANSTSAAVDSL